MTADPISFATYMGTYHPEVATLKRQYENADARWNQLLDASEDNPRITILQGYIADLKKGMDADAFHNGKIMHSLMLRSDLTCRTRVLIAFNIRVQHGGGRC